MKAEKEALTDIQHGKEGITIVVPVYNRAEVVGKTLESIRRQTWRPLSVVLVDNNSTDYTAEVLRAWVPEAEKAGIDVKVLSEEREGASAARNRGLREVATEYVMFFDSDDIMAPDHVGRAMKGFLTHPDAEIVGWTTERIFLDGHRRRLGFSDRNVKWRCLFNGMMATQRYAARTELMRRVGGWNESSLAWDDIELGTRLLARNPKVVALKGPVTVEIVAQECSITGLRFSESPERREHTIELIEENMPGRRYRHWVSLRRMLLAGCYAREGAMEDARRFRAYALAKERCPFYRLLMRMAYHYTAAGGRGAALILRPLY